MIALTNPPGIKTFSGLQTHTPNPPLGLAYVATALTEAGLAHRAIDATGEALDAVSPYPDRDHFMVQGLTLDEIVRRIDSETEVVGISCMFSTFWPLTHRLADDTPATLRQTLALIRRMAVLGVWDAAVSKFVPGSALFRWLQREGKIELDDAFFVSTMDFSTVRAASYADTVSIRRLYWTMLWLLVNFYVISFALRPWRVVRVLGRALLTGREETRDAKWFVDVCFTRLRWRSLAAGVVR